MTRVLIFTGDGKGKTTAALGTVLRAAGHGKRSLIIQFLKNDDTTGELAACRLLPDVEIVQMGCGFVPSSEDPLFAAHCKAAASALDAAAAALNFGSADLLVLDEICGAVAKGLIDEPQVVDLIRRETAVSCVILTGRNAGDRLIQAADTVTEMRCVCHGFNMGIAAQEGVEY